MDGELTGFTFGRYVVEEKVGSGGFATVYRAVDTQLNRPIALKILHANWSNNSSFVERFKQEAHFLANPATP